MSQIHTTQDTGHINVLTFQNPKGYTDIKQIEEQIVSTTSAVKLVMGVARALVFFTMLESLDKVQTANWYARNKKLFKAARKQMDDYDKNLLHARTNRLFCVNDMGDELRARYSSTLTDRQYFEYWIDMGASSYDRFRSYLLSLQNKYKLSLQEYGVKYAEEVSWAIMTEFALEEAEAMYKEGVLESMSKKIAIPEKILDTIYHSFRFDNVHKAWQRIIRAILPNPDAVSEYILSQRNVQLGIDDFHQRISSVLTSCDSIMEATEDNEDIWLNKTEYKRAKRMIRSVQKNIGK